MNELAPRGRTALAALWIIAFAASMSVPLVMDYMGLIGSPWAAAEKISVLYAPYTGTVVTFYFADRMPAKKTRKPAPEAGRTALRIAVVASILWNAILWSMVFVALAGPGEASFVDVLDSASRLAAQASWLLAPVMGYYFAVSKA